MPLIKTLHRKTTDITNPVTDIKITYPTNASATPSLYIGSTKNNPMYIIFVSQKSIWLAKLIFLNFNLGQKYNRLIDF